MNTIKLLPEGTLETGCNYWASHAGINMWKEWDQSVVEEDLKVLAAHGMTAVRVFPLCIVPGGMSGKIQIIYT